MKLDARPTRHPMSTSALAPLEEILSAVRVAAAESIAPSAQDVDARREFPANAIAALARCGALGLLVPVEQGGIGGGLSDLALACESVGEACASSGMVFLMHSVAAATVAGGQGPAAPALLTEMAAGSRLGTLAFSERGTGAHFYAPELQAVQDGENVRISGRKSFVTSGGAAGIYLVLVRTPGEGEGLDCYALHGEAPGLRFEGEWNGLGMAGNSSVAMVLDEVLVSPARRIGEPGGAGELVFDVVAPHFLVGLAAVNVGIAAAALAAARRHAAAPRYSDGSSLAEVQAIQHALANGEISLRGARGLLAEGAALGEDGSADALVAIMAAKVAATEAAEEVTGLALEICGGQGYTPALPVERHLRDARAGRVMAPTNAVLRSWIGKASAGLPVP